MPLNKKNQWRLILFFSVFERLRSSSKSWLRTLKLKKRKKEKRTEKRDKWNNDHQKALRHATIFSQHWVSEGSRTFTARPCGIFKLSLCRIARMTTFPLMWFDYLPWSSETVLFSSFQTKKVLPQTASTIRFACRCHSLVLFLFSPLGFFNSASSPSKANFLCVSRWCGIPSFYTVAGLYLMCLVRRQLSFTAFAVNSMKAPCD